MIDIVEYQGEHCPPISCPDCGGWGYLRVVVPMPLAGTPIDCSTCDGVGLLTPERYRWYLVGQRLRNWRIHVLGKGPRQAAEEWDMIPSELIHMEHGRSDPRRHTQWEKFRKWVACPLDS